MPRRRPEFELGLAVAEAAKLKKFSDAGELKFSGCPTQPRGPRTTLRCSGLGVGRNQFLKSFVYREGCTVAVETVCHPDVFYRVLALGRKRAIISLAIRRAAIEAPSEWLSSVVSPPMKIWPKG